MSLFSFLFGKRTQASGPAESRFRPGQVWAFKVPSDQSAARLIILRVEDGGKLGTIVHIGISDLHYAGAMKQIGHMPFAESAVAESVTTLEKESGPLPDFEDGYGEWRRAFDAGQAGVFTISVGKACEAVVGVAMDAMENAQQDESPNV